VAAVDVQHGPGDEAVAHQREEGLGDVLRPAGAADREPPRHGVAHLRTVAAADPDSADLASLVAELTAGSEAFAGLWRRYDVRVKSGTEKTFRHPSVGELTLSSEVLHLARGEQRLIVYQAPPGSRDHDALALLTMIAADDAPTRMAT
jgi:MmyB-like transcription regulator ligand binding domain